MRRNGVYILALVPNGSVSSRFYFLVDEPIYVLYVGLLAVAVCFATLRLSRHSLNRHLALTGGSLAVLACLIFLFVRGSEGWFWPLPCPLANL